MPSGSTTRLGSKSDDTSGLTSLAAKPDGLLFGYVEVPDTFDKAQKGMAAEEINTKWGELMSPYFERIPGAEGAQTKLELEEVFHTD